MKISVQNSGIAANALLALASLVLAYASYAGYTTDRASRIPARKFAAQYAMALRRPDIVESLEFAPSGDFAADLIADATLQDVASTVNLGGLTPRARAAWIDAVPKYDEEMAAASNLALDAIAERPGWPYHASLLGQLLYSREARSLSPDLVKNNGLWLKPLYEAAIDAGTDNTLWQSLAVAQLQTWADLSQLHAKTVHSVFLHAFEDPEFVASTFAPAVSIIGREAAFSALPDRARPLWAALQAVGQRGDIPAAWSLHLRWDAAEWRERKEDLAAIEKHAARRDVTEARALCVQWAAAHSVWHFDSKEAHAQAARLLEIWPAGTEGRWIDDPRSQIVRYFLGGRSSDVNGGALLRSIDSLAGVPLPVAARIHVVAGDIAGAESIAKSSDTFGTFEWTPYILELARYWNVRNDKTRARAALTQLASASREECDAQVVRREIEGSEKLSNGSRDLTSQAAVGSPIALCMDQSTPLSVRLTSAASAIVDYGWDGARSSSALVMSGSRMLSIPAPPQRGMRQLTTRPAVAGTAAEIAVLKS